MSNINAIRGMQDLLPEVTPLWQYLEATVAQLLGSYAYQEIRFPVLEKTELFKRSIGEVTDIVEKEMYSFEDRNGDRLSLRPEGTAVCVRACLQHGLLANQQTQRLWYNGPMFRRERPQKGRQRQFHQIGVEAFGMADADIDAEIILITDQLWQRLGLHENVQLQINSIGSLECRARYRTALADFLQDHVAELDEDSQRRLETNPLRILDSKSEQTQQLLNHAPDLLDYLDQESEQHFQQVKSLLDSVGVRYQVNSRLVRGLDYYCKTVFEWVTTDLGAQGTVCAGGRYDGLVEQLGGKPCAGVGFAMGIERLVLLLEAKGAVPEAAQSRIDIYLVVAGGEPVRDAALRLATQLREALPELKLLSHCGGGSIKSQMKKADKSGAELALILGETEVQQGSVTLKQLRNVTASSQQSQMSYEQLLGYLKENNYGA